MSDKNLQTTLEIKQGGFVYCLSNDENLLYIVQTDRLLAYEFYTGTFNIITQFNQIELNRTYICVSSDDQICCVITQTAVKDQVLYALLKFDLQKKVLSQIYLNYHLMQIEMIEFIPNSHILISLSLDATIKIFDFSNQKPKTVLTKCQQRPIYCRLIQQQKRLIIIDNLFNIKFIDPNNEKQIKAIKLRQGNCFQAMTEENGITAIFAKSKKFYFYDLPKQKLIRKFKAPDNYKLFKIHYDYLIYLDRGKILLVNVATCKNKYFKIENIHSMDNIIFNQNQDKLILCDREQIYIIQQIKFQY